MPRDLSCKLSLRTKCISRVFSFVLFCCWEMSTQIFSPNVTGPPDVHGNPREKEVAAVHYSADKMDPHGR